MRKSFIAWMCLTMLATLPAFGQTTSKKWSLQDCIDYALQNNITLKKNQMQKTERRD